MVYLRTANRFVPDDDRYPGFPTAKVIDFREITKHPDRFNICLTQKAPPPLQVVEQKQTCQTIEDISLFGAFQFNFLTNGIG
jgi:hypothetical protein